MAEHAIETEEDGTAYTPVFNTTIRTIVYVVGLVASVVSLGLVTFGMPEAGGFVASAAGIITGGFGVAYNPTRLAGK